MSDWAETTLGHVIELKRGYDLPQRERMPGRVPLVSSSGVTDYHSEAKVKGPGVVTGRYGTLGQVFYLADDFWPLNTTLYVRDFKGNDPRFVSYFLTSLDYLAYSDKAAVPGLNRNDLHQAPIRFPTDVREQRAIAHVLGTLDDKIELNRRMSETLGAMVRALFKSWFVDFDPVRAKAEGRDPGLPEPLADLFPSRLVDCELGAIPEGWQVARLGELANVEKGLSYKGAGLVDAGGLPMVNLGCFAGRGIFKADNIKRYSGDYRERHLVRAGDLVVANTDMTQNRLVLGSPALVPELDGERQFLFTHHTFALRFRPGFERWRRYVYFALLQPEFREVAEGFATGTTVLALPRDGLFEYRVGLPTEPLRAAFERQVETWFRATGVRRGESRTLASLRDALLPKLISGELRVSDANAVLATSGA